MGLLSDVSRLFFPPVCPACGGAMPEGAGVVCNRCRWEIPLTGFWQQRDNPVLDKFRGHLPVERAASFFYYLHDSGMRSVIHKFKYQGGWRLALDMGQWFGAELHASGLWGDIDVIVPVPLHIRKRLSRGYNQSEYIARGMARAMGTDVDTRSVRRSVHNKSQTLRDRNERWDNVEGIFLARDGRLGGKSVLLVDDVLTTGATIVSCGEAILRAAPDCRLSVATLAVSKHEIGLTVAL